MRMVQRMRKYFSVLAIMIALILALLSQLGALAESMEDQASTREDAAETVSGTTEEKYNASESSMDAANEAGDYTNEQSSAGEQQDAATTEEQNATGEQGSAAEDQSSSQGQKVQAEKPVYTVYFFDYDGAEIEPLRKDVPEDEYIEDPKWAPAHDGLAFLYWFDEEDETRTPFQFDWESVSKELRLIARYELIPTYYETETEPIPDGFDTKGMSGTPEISGGKANAPAPKTPAGTVIEDDNVKGTVVGHKKGAGFVVTIINVDEEKREEDAGFVVSFTNMDGDNSNTGEKRDESESPDDDAGFIVSFTNVDWENGETDEGETPDDGAGFVVSITHIDDDQSDEGEEPEEGEEPVKGEELVIEGEVYAKLAEERSYQIGETVTLQGYVEGFEGAAGLAYQWQYSADGETWVDAEDATQLSHSFTLSEENQHYKWQMVVFVTAPEEDEVD